MNQQIKLPAQEWLGYDPERGNIHGYTFEQMREFSLLIVRECARIAAQTPCPYEDEFAKQTYGHTWDMACVESAKNIRKHFGVRE